VFGIRSGYVPLKVWISATKFSQSVEETEYGRRSQSVEEAVEEERHQQTSPTHDIKGSESSVME
jgi:hypothetical protein